MSISLLALLDDITTILDDVSVMAKAAAQKTVGVLGDDLALNAQQVSGVESNRVCPWSGPWPRGRSSTRRSSCPQRC